MTRRAGEPKPSSGLKKAGLTGSVVIMMAALIGLLTTWEGKSNKPYRDVAGIETVCYGETRIQMRDYSDAECLVQLESAAADFAEQVRIINPGLADHPLQWAAHGSLAYNIGVKGYRKSSVARLFREGRHAEACRAIGKYRYSGGKVWKGLVLRRNGDARRMGEIEVCLMGLEA